MSSVASQDIEPGEIIIDEPAIVRGPCVDTNPRNGEPGTLQQTRLACCVCFGGFGLSNLRCNKCDCNLFCSKECSLSTLHADNECKILKLVKTFTKTLSVLTYCNVVTTVRCLSVRRKNPLQWLQICKLQSKVDELDSIGAFAELDYIFEQLNWMAFGLAENELDCGKMNAIQLVSAARHCYGLYHEHG
ncbi:unnamed protein product [Allacma fusca]|uniref:Uncharacterized protein n=1 Tax=Allacma fusca TaxID=39272 RepID=A0A8J2KE64_9HEXA|nr:unnamed protein product [Allacma fusca]